MKDRIENRFAALSGRKAFVAFVTAGDPDYETSRDVLLSLPDWGVDVVELGMPFSDPTADGPAIEASYVRSLANGHRMAKTLSLAREFRAKHPEAPLVLFGYFNPVHAYGVEKFLKDAEEAGVDGFLIVDLPAERDSAFCDLAVEKGFAMIRLVAPTTPEEKYPLILRRAGGFVYNIAVEGVTGVKSATAGHIAKSVAAIKAQTKVPVATGFGIKTAQQAAEAAAGSDAVVVGSAIVAKIGALGALPEGKRKDGANDLGAFVKEIADAVHAA